MFGHATFHGSDDFRLVGGLRYAEDSKQQRDNLDWNVWPPVPIPGSGLDGNWDDVLWKVAAEYDLRDEMMLYGTASTGYRAGGINFVAPGVPLTYGPESVTAFEIGLKSRLLGRALTLNVASYYNLIAIDRAGATETIRTLKTKKPEDHTLNADCFTVFGHWREHASRGQVNG